MVVLVGRVLVICGVWVSLVVSGFRFRVRVGRVLVGRVLVVSGVWVPVVVSGFRFRVRVGRVLVGVGPLLV